MEVTQRILELERDIARLPPTFTSIHERRAYYINLVQLLVTKFRDLATTREIPSADEAHLAVASQTFELYKDFSNDLQSSIPDFLADEYREKLEEMVSRTRGGSLSNFLSHPIFYACVKEGFIEPLTLLSGELVIKAESYIADTLRSLLEVEANRTARSGHPIPGMTGASIQLRQVIMQETMEFLKVREIECQAHIDIRSKAEEYICTLDGVYGKTIEDLKHEGQRDDKWSYFR